MSEDLSPMQMQADRQHRRNFIGYLVAMMLTAVVILFLISLMVWNDHTNVSTREQTKRDRIAACVTSDDVVGCLKAAEGA